MKTLHHTETTWQGRKIIIDASDLTAEYGYIEVMALYPDGREIECYHTHNPEDARLMFNHYCDLAADRPTADTYTRQDWERTGVFNAHPGQAITAEIYDEFYNCMPPYSLPRDLRRDGHKGFDGRTTQQRCTRAAIYGFCPSRPAPLLLWTCPPLKLSQGCTA
ncbi:hypothetical protein [Agathobaculum butyriciproducens]|jgi:hypothetical protein|uniref:hypothetical protein n=1 Tax=Agathobaculum butyriciproducens TaxID=1628085 RepID=UPI003A8C817D